MANISSTGIGSGLDVGGIVSQILAAEGQPATFRLDQKELGLQAKLTALGTFKGALSSFQNSLAALNQFGHERVLKATVGDGNILGASAGPAAAAGSYDVEVLALARTHGLSHGFAAADEVVGSGTLTLRFGTDTGSGFVVNGERGTHTIDIDPANNTLSGVRDAINAANAGVNASIIFDGTSYNLVVTSNYTGTGNSLKITVSGDGDGNDLDDIGLSRLAYDPDATTGSGKNMGVQQTAQDAQARINSLLVVSQTNVIDNAIEGLVLTLKEVNATPVRVSVAPDDSGFRSAVNDFISKYNLLIETVNDISRYNSETKEAGVLLGDAAVRGVMSDIRSHLSRTVPGLGGIYNALSAVGISTQSDGTLKVDDARLNSALDSDYAAVVGLFAAKGSPSDASVRYIGSTNATQTGRHDVFVTQTATHGEYQGVAIAFPKTVADGSNSFSLSIDGIASNTITITPGSYSSSAEFIAEIQGQINGDSALRASGVSVVVGESAGKIVFTSNSYGSDSSVNITSSTAGIDLGLVVANGVAGLDVAGTIGGQAATGAGRILTGTGISAGLSIEIAGGATGDRGVIQFSRGMADVLDMVMNRYLDSDGALEARKQGINNRLDDINEQREALSKRLQAMEARLYNQFTALDALMAQLRSTSDYLTQQLSKLPGARKIG